MIEDDFLPFTISLVETLTHRGYEIMHMKKYLCFFRLEFKMLSFQWPLVLVISKRMKRVCIHTIYLQEISTQTLKNTSDIYAVKLPITN